MGSVAAAYVAAVSGDEASRVGTFDRVLAPTRRRDDDWVASPRTAPRVLAAASSAP